MTAKEIAEMTRCSDPGCNYGGCRLARAYLYSIEDGYAMADLLIKEGLYPEKIMDAVEASIARYLGGFEKYNEC